MFRWVKRCLACHRHGILLVLLLPTVAIAGGRYDYGSTPTAAQIAGWNIDVRPDGQGLPAGSGTVDQGEKLFESQCAACHGFFGQGKAQYPNLDDPSLADLKTDNPIKTVGNFWPYATTLYDYIHRAMPFYAPQSLKPDQVYALTAYVLNLNDIVASDFIANAKTLPAVKMPNRNGFILHGPRPETRVRECMKHCVNGDALQITSTAAGKNIAPPTTGPADSDDAAAHSNRAGEPTP